MTDSELLFELIKRTGFWDERDKFELIDLLLDDIIEHQDWGYGCDEQIKTSLRERIKKIVNKI